MNPWLIASLGLFLVWIIIFIIKPAVRKEMFWVSIFTMPLGLTEPLFVPEYWSPPSLFDLASKTGFDIESLIFCFAVGGIASVLYELPFRIKHVKISRHEINREKHTFHLFSLALPFLIFALLSLSIELNPIYSASISVFGGGLAAILCRPDLKKKILTGGIAFLILYFVSFLFFNLFYPGLVQEVWNLSAISGILIVGVPLEELLFAFTLGMFWSSVYEHIRGYKLIEVKGGR